MSAASPVYAQAGWRQQEMLLTRAENDPVKSASLSS
jgi:hypothetical protein